MMEYDGCQFFSPEKDFPIWGFFYCQKYISMLIFFGPKHCPSEKCGGLETQHHLELRHLPFLVAWHKFENHIRN
jgi:hypothetical protein